MSRADEFFGTKDPSRLFPGGNPKATVPWDSAGPTKTHRAYDVHAVEDAVRNPDKYGIQSLDPRRLHATQPGLQRAAVDYYFSGRDWREHGTTFADQHNPGNRVPVVFHNTLTDRHVILSGHHRATASLLHGDQFHALVVSGEPSTHADARAHQEATYQQQRAARIAARG